MDWNIDGILERLGLRHNITGLALSGGGARGFSHLGVFKALEKFDMVPDVMSGVSAGSIAASLYGAGLSVDDIIECFTESSSFGNYTEWSIPTQAFLKLERFGRLMEKWLPVKNLEDMKIPTVICAVDFDRGVSKGWSKGEIVPRVLASCSIPIIFPPVKINGVNYVDGGVLRNLPAWAIRDCCNTLIGSNCSPMKKEYEPLGSIVDITYRTFQMMMKSNTAQDLRLCDYIIEIVHHNKVSTFDLSNLRRGVALGYDAACRTLEKIKK